MRISDWSSDVCSSGHGGKEGQAERSIQGGAFSQGTAEVADLFLQGLLARVIVLDLNLSLGRHWAEALAVSAAVKNAIQIIATRNMLAAEIIWEVCARAFGSHPDFVRSEEHTSELQSLMRISYAVFCLKKKNEQNQD